MYNSNGEVPRPFLSIVLSKFVMTFNLLAMFVRTLILRRVKKPVQPKFLCSSSNQQSERFLGLR